MASIQISDDLLAQLKKLSSDYGKRHVDLVELILRAFLKKYEFKFIGEESDKEKKVKTVVVSYDEFESIIKEIL